MTMQARKFAEDWIQSWNSHKIEDILSHYADNIVITTPMIKVVGGTGSGTLSGKKNVADYWQKALKMLPNLKFELIDVTEGVSSIAIYYRSVLNKNAIEVMFFNEEGKVYKMIAHYTN